MATIRRRGQRWQVQVRRKGRPALSRSFSRKSEALAWAREQELEADKGLLPVHKTRRGITVADIVTRYRDEVVPRKRGSDRETVLLNAFLRQPLAHVNLSDVTTGLVSAYCAQRLCHVKPGTVNRELDILRHAFAVARRNWDIPLARNVFAEVTRPKGSAPRERRLQRGEWASLQLALAQCRNDHIRYLVELALETDMRRGEILRAQWHDVSFEKRLTLLRIIKGQSGVSERVIPLTENAAKMSWKRLVKRARLKNLRFHDMRHEAISRFFEKRLNVPEVALISGHRDLRMLFRYTHPRPEDIALKL